MASFASVYLPSFLTTEKYKNLLHSEESCLDENYSTWDGNLQLSWLMTVIQSESLVQHPVKFHTDILVHVVIKIEREAQCVNGKWAKSIVIIQMKKAGPRVEDRTVSIPSGGYPGADSCACAAACALQCSSSWETSEQVGV